jgi:hypothetical protein
MPEPRQLLDRLHRSLVEEIRASHPDYLRSSFTVAEIYQNLVPYRTHRDRIGVEMNGDYEDALLRLLAGEGDYLVLESEPARRRIESELRSPNPNTTIYREFAAAGVRLNPALIPPGSEQEADSVRPGVRVDIGFEAPPSPVPRRGGGVNPELGLFVADLFGESGGEGDRIAGEAEPARPTSGVQPAAAQEPAPAESTPPVSTPAPRASPEGADPAPVAAVHEENARLRRIVADQALEIQRLRERLEGR